MIIQSRVSGKRKQPDDLKKLSKLDTSWCHLQKTPLPQVATKTQGIYDCDKTVPFLMHVCLYNSPLLE